MKLSFLGAAKEVTGSCHYLQACGKNILIDCGMQQGPDEYAHQETPMTPSDIDFILLTHAHIDHSGRIPLMTKLGFQGKICATEASCDLCSIMLRDSAHIQEFEAEWKNRKGKRAGAEPVEPLYTMEDAQAAIEQFMPFPYEQRTELAPGLEVRFRDAGHLLGSAAVELWVTEGQVTKKIVFSGDIGNLNQPIINDPEYVHEADFVVMESTYGNRVHEAPPDFCQELANIVQRTFDRGGNVVIPSFAVGRTQELLYFFREVKEKNMVQGYPDFPVYVDSPLAIEATKIFMDNEKACYDADALALVRKGINPIAFPGLRLSVTSDDSKAINAEEGCKVIISASGMCEAGRIKHHLKHNLWRRECSVVFVGYQAHGTLGRSIQEGAREVRLFGETIEVFAEIVKLQGLSGHADKNGLLQWVKSLRYAPERIFVVHGEESVAMEFAQALRDDLGYAAVAPNYLSQYDLTANQIISEGVPRPLRTAKMAELPTGVYGRLVAAGKRLMRVIAHNEGGANKELTKFIDQINALCEKWDR